MTITPRMLRWFGEALLVLVLCWWAYSQGVGKTNEAWESRMEAAQKAADENTKSIEQSMLNAIEEVKKDADEQLAAQATRIAAADAQSRSLRVQVSGLRDQLIAEGASAGRERHASNAAAVVLADLYGSCVADRQELAAAFDRSHAAGLTCQKSYAIVRSVGSAPSP
ncbi:hypothetical protein [Pseudomonas phage LUZ7]|uniref:DUF2514 domain-containing protein n=1 Tax=Pseudomonas phage LUZ7 TaxID=655097 RepID=C8ZKE6_9CAUD|nr:Rz-like spanin [Pseudomonas phage LUZ7]CAZ66193.1 hypothetical protein [Pseudomonas phage LUZ7]